MVSEEFSQVSFFFWTSRLVSRLSTDFLKFCHFTLSPICICADKAFWSRLLSVFQQHSGVIAAEDETTEVLNRHEKKKKDSKKFQVSKVLKPLFFLLYNTEGSSGRK